MPNRDFTRRIGDVIRNTVTEVRQENPAHEITLVTEAAQRKIWLKGRVYLEFGDLRVDTENAHIVFELEGGSNLTNLLKYWYLVETGRISKHVVLVHIWRAASENDYYSHRQLWNFLYGKMQDAIGLRIDARMHIVRDYDSLLDSDVDAIAQLIREVL